MIGQTNRDNNLNVQIQNQIFARVSIQRGWFRIYTIKLQKLLKTEEWLSLGHMILVRRQFLAFWTQVQRGILNRSNMVPFSYLSSYNSASCSMFRPNWVSVPNFVPVLVSVPASFFKNVINCSLKKYSYNNLLINFTIKP